MKLCGNCQHWKKGFTTESNPTGKYCEIDEQSCGVANVCNIPRRFKESDGK